MSLLDAPVFVSSPRCAAPRVVRVGLLGYGRVGQAVATLIRSAGDRLAGGGLDVRATAALVRDAARPRGGPAITLCDGAAEFFSRRFDVVIDVMGGVRPAFDLVRRALVSGVPVVTANKTLMAARGDDLRAIARAHGTLLACDAAVLAGVPFLGALARRPLVATPRRIAGIVNGTSHFLACRIADGVAFGDALEEAVARGYAEPDSQADISGRDAAEKLAVLLQLTGCRGAAATDFTRVGLDVLTDADIAGARALDGVLKPIVLASLDPSCPGAWVGPALVDRSHPCAASTGVANFVTLTGADDVPVTFSGPGAGPDVTALTILDDVLELLSLGPARAPLACAPATPVSRESLGTPPPTSWFLRIACVAGVSTDDAAEWLAVHGLAARRLVRQTDCIFARTTVARWPTVRQAADAFTALGAEVLALPVIEGGHRE